MIPVLLAFFGLFFPRLTLLVIYFATDWPQKAYATTILPILGWFFLPTTTLVYMGAMLNNHYSVNGGWLVLMILAVIVDLCRASSSDDKKK